MTSGGAQPATGDAGSIEECIARMQEIGSSLPSTDGVACFNRMYLEVTQDVQVRLSQGFFSDPTFMETLDVVFANLYFAAVDVADGPAGQIPAAWLPLIQARGDSRIYPIQFALAGMNAHINHDLPIALVETCQRLGSGPDQGSHHADYQKVDTLLDAAEQSVRQSFESGVSLETDRDAQAVLDLVANWSINSARDVAWDTAMALWMSRDVDQVEDLLMGGLARTVAMASRCLLVAA
jgi:Family of unknown function (DUF5995)